MLREGGTQSFEVALKWDTYILGIQKYEGGGCNQFSNISKGDIRSFTLSRARMQQVLNPHFSYL